MSVCGGIAVLLAVRTADDFTSTGLYRDQVTPYLIVHV